VVYLIYIDESRDPEKGVGVFSALAIPVAEWREALEQVRMLRRKLKETDGIYMTKEFHASDFVAGRGRIAPCVVTKHRRCEIFGAVLETVTRLPGARLFNVVYYSLKREYIAFERMLNRINRTMEVWRSHAILVCDEGKEPEYTKLARRMGIHNPIQSIYGTWENGSRTKNITIDRIIEDPFFKDSRRSYFIQLVDFCAFALLRREFPVLSRTKYGLHEVFNLLSETNILVREASRSDPEGIVRVKL
jgi:hypothetical protein